MITTPHAATAPHKRNHGQKLIATCGLPGSGKSSWARAQLAQDSTGHLVRCNRDDLRRMLHGEPRYDTASEAVVTTVQRAILSELLFRGHSIIVDDTNLDPTHLNALAELAACYDATFLVKDFTNLPLFVCVQRDAMRPPGRRVGEKVIRDMHARYLAGAPS